MWSKALNREIIMCNIFKLGKEKLGQEKREGRFNRASHKVKEFE